MYSDKDMSQARQLHLTTYHDWVVHVNSKCLKDVSNLEIQAPNAAKCVIKVTVSKIYIGTDKVTNLPTVLINRRNVWIIHDLVDVCK